jgi:hypothetical protein
MRSGLDPKVRRRRMLCSRIFGIVIGRPLTKVSNIILAPEPKEQKGFFHLDQLLGDTIQLSLSLSHNINLYS